jgi:hypothetical protein
MPSNAGQRVILLQSTEKEYIIVSNGPYKRHRGQYFYTVQTIGGEFTIAYNTQDEDKQAQKHTTTQKTKNMSNKHPTKNRVFYAL